MRRSIRYMVPAVLALGCGDGPFDPRGGLEPFAGGVSDAVDGVAWVSAAPGSQPAASTAMIRNERTGESVVTPVNNRGFDPVSVEAAAGDLLIIEFDGGGDAADRVRAEVPGARPPHVVRTVTTGVAPDAPIVVMFSEPIAPASVTTQTVALNTGGQRVVAAVVPLPPPSLGARLFPAHPLAWGTAYELVLGAAIEDLSGDPLDGPRSFNFSTAPDGNPVTIGVSAELIDFGYAPAGGESPAAFTSDKPVEPGQFATRIRGDVAFRLGAGNCGSAWPLQQLHRCELAVRFTPTPGDERRHAATLELSDASGVRASIELRASTRGPALKVRTTGALPQSIMVGFVSDPVTVTVTNEGFAPTEPLATRHFWYDWDNDWYEVPPEQSALQITDDSCDGTTLAPGASCTMLVAFAPRTASAVTQALYFDERQTGGFEVAGWGTGLYVSPSGHQFPPVAVGTSLSAYSVLTNTADQPTGPIAVQLAPGAFGVIVELDHCSGRQLAPDEVCSVSFRFEPGAPGDFQGALRFKASPGGEATTWLSGSAQ
jgi:hypothetical protein